ncbi:PLC-like phosphodiesterase, TIM beta/alpha-barrel domain protein [Beauveria brongniartii RCEF 3172]|uniref:PLC-like phosphodiesterase, TIM beta/alpha-barrel domain protein n=1 Tax=Beauveria brongniartii RCEF 3172 TaxID=1081107 RepID=A0A166ZHI7_9HYPO|nr:PLC-like phosphodiesterase, TIM beta/alpha-barrel domain protein [Beauveria brongniartii RCEF 3172]
MVAPFAAAIPSARDPTRLLPQTVAHRGYKAQWPENSLEGMRAAVQAGAHGIETDVHLTRDGVVVMSHDASLKRCFGVAKRIADCDWEYISTLRSVRPPHVEMPRLSDVLGLLTEECMQKTWCVLDIKIDDEADQLLSSMRNVLATTKGPVPWEHRILLGCWNATYITAARRILPAFPLTHISWSRSYSAHFGAAMPNLGYSLHFGTLSGVLGRRFLARHHRNRRGGGGGAPVMTWTVNQDNWMRWLLDRNLVQDRRCAGGGVPVAARRVLDAVITDDPRQFREACARWEDELDGTRPRPRLGLVSRVRSGWGEVLEAAKLTLLWVVLQAVTRFSKRLDTLPDVMKRKVQ